MKYALISVAFLLYLAKPVYAKDIALPPPTSPKVDTSSISYIKSRIHNYATLYNVSEITMLNVIHCESNFNPQANGDNNTSHGLVQIHLSAHPDITHTEAHDVDFSLNFLAENLKEGHGNMWACFRQN